MLLTSAKLLLSVLESDEIGLRRDTRFLHSK